MAVHGGSSTRGKDFGCRASRRDSRNLSTFRHAHCTPVDHFPFSGDHIMSTQYETTARGIAGCAETATRIAAVISSASDRLITLQTEAGGAAFADNAQALHAALSVAGGPAAMTVWPGLCQANVVRVLEVTRRWLEIMSGAETDIARLTGERFAVPGLGLPLVLGQFTKAMTEIHGAALAGMQEVLATVVVPVVASGAKKR
jgi:phasin family protein